MFINKEDIEDFNVRISNLDSVKKDKLLAILNDRYEYGFPNKELFTKFKYKYTEGIKSENLSYLDEFNYYYYTKPKLCECCQNNILDLEKLYKLVESIDEKTFNDHINLVISVGKIAKFKDNIYNEIEKNIVLNKKDKLESCLLYFLKNYINEEKIKSVINETISFKIFDELISIINKEFYGLENINLKYKIITLIKLAKWMIFSKEIKYLEDIEETNNFDNQMEKIIKIYENKFIEDGINKLEEYFNNLNIIEENFLEHYNSIGLDKSIELIILNIENQDEKELISDYLRCSASIDESIQGINASFDILENIFGIKN